MAQIRAFRNHLTAPQVDSLPSYRFFKQRFLSTDEARAVFYAIAIVPTLGFVDDISGPYIQELLDFCVGSFVGNSPYIETPTQENGNRFCNGAVSRMSGICNSCPSTNAKMF